MVYLKINNINSKVIAFVFLIVEQIKIAVDALLTILGLFEGIVAIVAAGFTCKCCGNYGYYGGPIQDTYQVTLSQSCAWIHFFGT